MKDLILTIDPGTRYWGVSVFHGRDLITCMVKNLSTKDSSRNALPMTRRLFSSLYHKYRPTVLVIESPYEHWKSQSDSLCEVVKELKLLSRKMHLRVIEFTPNAVRKIISNRKQSTQDDIAEEICTLCPEFKAPLGTNPNFTNKYWKHMSRSISLGICYSLGNCQR